MNLLPIIKTDRSRIADLEKCPRIRYWRYHYNDTGMEPTGEGALKLDARIGTWTHNGIEQWLTDASLDIAFGDGDTSLAGRSAMAAAAGFAAEARSVVDWDQLNTEQKFQIVEAGYIVKALVYAWCRVRGPLLLQEGDILALEQEMDVDFDASDDVVRLMTRPDVVYKRKLDDEVLIRNIKTVREPNTTWREQWSLDMQTLSEAIAVDKWLGRSKCGGVTIDGLITGKVLEYPEGTGHYYHNTPLLYAWCKKGINNDPPFEVPDVWYTRYNYTCSAPHKMGNGHQCSGGKSHKLSGVTKESIEERYKGGVIAWIDYLLQQDRALVEEQLVELPPIMRSEWQIERWKRQTLYREVETVGNAKHVEFIRENDPGCFEAALDEYFPMHTASGNCLRPGKCAFYDCCWGSSASDPFRAGYQPRLPNHPQELLKG